MSAAEEPIAKAESPTAETQTSAPDEPTPPPADTVGAHTESDESSARDSKEEKAAEAENAPEEAADPEPARPTRFRTDGAHVTEEPRRVVRRKLAEVQRGDVLAAAIHSERGTLLVPEETVIDDRLRRRLARCLVFEVDVYERTPTGKRLAIPAPAEPTRIAFFRPDVDKVFESHVNRNLRFVANRTTGHRGNHADLADLKYEPDFVETLAETDVATKLLAGHALEQLAAGAAIDLRLLRRTVARERSFLESDPDATLSADDTADRSLVADGLRLMRVSMAAAIAYGLDRENVERIGLAGLVHDWGWTGLPAGLRNRDQPLTGGAHFEASKHPGRTREMLTGCGSLPPLVLRLVAQVHERPDGGGYPRGESGSQVHLFSRILHVASEYLDRTTGRHRERRLTPYAAMTSLLTDAARSAVDPLAVRALLRALSLFPIGSYVRLSDGRIARVLRANGDRYTQPVVEPVMTSGPRSEPLSLTRSELTIVGAVSHEREPAKGPSGPHFLSSATGERPVTSGRERGRETRRER